MILTGEVKGVKDGQLWVACPVSSLDLERLEGYKSSVAVELTDGRTISRQQQKKCYLLIRYIAEWWGYMPQEAMKELLKYDFFGQGEILGMPHKDGLFSLSDCDMTTARKFISWLIEFCLVHDIPCGEPLWKLAEDVQKYVWVAAIHKRCAVCGKKAELHHADAVGSGRNRKEICHIGMRCLPLCREHHQAIHKIGRDSFCKKYILEPVEIDEKIAEAYRLKR